MADDVTLPGTGQIIAADNVTLMNGAASTNVDVQRVKLCFGDPGTAWDAAYDYPMPVAFQQIPGTILEWSGNDFATTFRTPGRAGTAGQKLLTIWNNTVFATGNYYLKITELTIQQTATVVKAITVLPPVARVYFTTAAPTGGTVLTTNSIDPTNIVVRGDASADGTLSAAALAATPAGMAFSAKFMDRMIVATTVGVDNFKVVDLLGTSQNPLVVNTAGGGIIVALDYTLATQNPATDMWLVTCKWTECK